MSPPSVVFMFPGQSSRSRRMFAQSRAFAPRVTADVLERASDVLGRDVGAIGRGDEPFTTNVDVQVGVFVASHIRLVALEAAGVRADLSLGLSLGEYNHLVHVGALDFEDALRLIDARGHAYDRGPSGAMAAVFPLPLDELEPLVARAAAHGEIAVSNVNSPAQHVVGGERRAIDALLTLVEEETFAQARVIEERIPMHTPRFRPVAPVLGAILAAARWRRTAAPYLPNVTGELLHSPSAGEIVRLLTRHVYDPVLWRRSMETAVAALPTAVFVEVGPGRVLTGLLRRGWLDVPHHTTADSDDFVATLSTLATPLARGA